MHQLQQKVHVRSQHKEAPLQNVHRHPLRLHRVPQNVPLPIDASRAFSDPHRRETVHLRHLLQEFLPLVPLQGARPVTFGRKALQVQLVRQELLQPFLPVDAFLLPQDRETVQVRALLQEIHAIRRLETT